MISISDETQDDEDDDPLSPIDDMRGSGKKSNVFFEASAKEDGSAYEKLRARIHRKYLDGDCDPHSKLCAGLYYINTYGTEIHPSPNAEFIQHLGKKEILVYSCGSLWTRLVLCRAARLVTAP